MIDHACEICGTIRRVSPDKLARGLQRHCRRCQGPLAAEKRRIAMLARGGKRRITYVICKECGKDYESRSINDTGYCCETCSAVATKRGVATSSFSRRLISGELWPAVKQAGRSQGS